MNKRYTLIHGKQLRSQLMSGSGESDKVTIYAESDGSRYEVEYPPTSKVDLDQLTSDLGLPGYIDLLSGKYEGLKFKGAMTPLLMGGIAVKFLSKSSNEPGPMNRLVKDIDYI